MKLIIDIWEDTYKSTCRGSMLPPHVENVVNAIKNGTPLSKGHWKLVQRGKWIDICCSNCEAVRVKEYAYNYTIDQLDKEDVKKCFESDDMRYCPYCGSDNRKVKE